MYTGPENPPQNGPFGLVGHGLQVGFFPSPAHLVALTPKDLPRTIGAREKDFQDKVLPGAKELLGDTEAKARLANPASRSSLISAPVKEPML